MKINGPHGVMDSVTRQAAGQHASGCAGLFGYGLVTDRNGEPISPGGLRMTGELLDRAGFAIADHVVDVGCGQGRSLGVMIRRGLNVVGVDTDAAPLAMARNLFPNVDLFCCSGAAMPIDNEAMDGVLSECVLTVMPDHRAALAEWFRVLRAGGKLALCDVYARNPDMSGSDERAIRLLSADRVRKAIGTAGFQLLYFEDRSECLRNFVARFIFRFGSLDALWGDARTSAQMHALKPGYYMAIAVKPIDRPANTNRANSQEAIT
ncbi:DVU_1556 family methyltransferase [Cohaesibacter marisflavi]|uniref:DVU_1556 family methyltransferase n=1 Tax=Cohaesibacter marisflavi TaxID=655353 RepID=UPI0029C85D32|nr:class I SAM-dependent methyltransferase [Cohaesibacter marisflavi]